MTKSEERARRAERWVSEWLWKNREADDDAPISRGVKSLMARMVSELLPPPLDEEAEKLRIKADLLAVPGVTEAEVQRHPGSWAATWRARGHRRAFYTQEHLSTLRLKVLNLALAEAVEDRRAELRDLRRSGGTERLAALEEALAAAGSAFGGWKVAGLADNAARAWDRGVEAVLNRLRMLRAHGTPARALPTESPSERSSRLSSEGWPRSLPDPGVDASGFIVYGARIQPAYDRSLQALRLRVLLTVPDRKSRTPTFIETERHFSLELLRHLGVELPKLVFREARDLLLETLEHEVDEQLRSAVLPWEDPHAKMVPGAEP